MNNRDSALDPVWALVDGLAQADSAEEEMENRLAEKLEAMPESRRTVLEEMARMALKSRKEAAEIKEEVDRLKEKRSQLDGRYERLLKMLQRECPETTRFGSVTLQYMFYTRVDVTDEAAAIHWLKEQKLDRCYRQPPATIYKKEVRKLIDGGRKVPGCSIVDDHCCYLKSRWDDAESSGNVREKTTYDEGG